jgi:4-amino-4-deoxy-L-arabinose transferase-like glycosyltransferase
MKGLIKNWWRAGVGGFFVLILGLILRLYHLTILPVFVDEAIYIRWAQVMRAEATLRFLPLSDGKQPLFMWLVIPFLKIFSDPLFAGRFVSVLSGCGTLVGVMVLSYLLFKSKKVALIAGLIYAISPFTVFFDRMALADSLLSMFGIWTFVFGIITAKTLRLDFAMFTGFALGGAYLTKSPALFFLLMLPLTWVFATWQNTHDGSTASATIPVGWKARFMIKFIKLFSLSLVSVSISQVAYNILLLGPNFGMISSRNLDYVWPYSHILTSPLDPLRPFLDRSFEWLRMMGPWPILLLAAFGLLVTVKKYWKENLVLLAWFLVPIVVQSEYAKVFTARYILFSVPYLIALAGTAFINSTFHLKRAKASPWGVLVLVVQVFLVLFVISALLFDIHLFTDPSKANLPRSERSGYLEEWTAGTGIKEVADYLRSEMQTLPAGSQVVVGTEGFFGTLPDGLEIYLNDLHNVTVIGVGVIIDQVHESLIASQKAGNKTYLVVNSSRFKIKNPDEFGLKLIAAYPKAERPDGIREYVQYGPRDFLYFFELTSKVPTTGVK